jgi:hypothetical protein
LIQVKNAQSNDALVLTVTDGPTFCFSGRGDRVRTLMHRDDHEPIRP